MNGNIAKLITGPFQINTWVVPLEENYVMVIDPAACALTQDENKILDYLKANSLIPAAFLLTHGHFDHIMGTKILKQNFPECPLLCHKEDSPMAGPAASQVQAPALAAMGLDFLSEGLLNLPAPDTVFSSETTIYEILKEKNLPESVKSELKNWQVFHTPGHTKGSVCYYNSREGILFSGDTIFYHSYGRTDLPGGSEAQITKSLNRIYSTLPPETLVFPGHETAGFPLKENF